MSFGVLQSLSHRRYTCAERHTTVIRHCYTVRLENRLDTDLLACACLKSNNLGMWPHAAEEAKKQSFSIKLSDLDTIFFRMKMYLSLDCYFPEKKILQGKKKTKQDR